MVMIIWLYIVMINYDVQTTVVNDTLQLYSVICYVSCPMANRKCHTKRHLELWNNTVSHTTFMMWPTCQPGFSWCLSVLQSVWCFAYTTWPCSYSVPILYYCSVVFYSLCNWLFCGVTCLHAILSTSLFLLLLFCIRFVLITCLFGSIRSWIFCNVI